MIKHKNILDHYLLIVRIMGNTMNSKKLKKIVLKFEDYSIRIEDIFKSNNL